MPVVPAVPVVPGVPGEGSEASGLLAAVEAIAWFVSAFEPARFSGGDAATLVSLFARAERLCVSGRALAAARAAEAHCHLAAGHRSAVEWLAATSGESVGEAAGVLRAGEVSAAHPGMEGALRDGRLSRSRAALVSGAVSANPDREADLVSAASTDTFRQLQDRCRRARSEARSRTDARALAAELHRRRHCRTWTDEDGAVRLDARLTPLAGASLLASLRAESDRVFARARRDGTRETRDAYRADALVALVTGRGIIGPGPARAEPDGGEPDGAGSVEPDGADPDAGSPPAAPATDRAPADRAPDPKAVVHLRVDLDALRRGSLAGGEVCEIRGVGTVPVETARSLLGDALCDLVVTNGVDVTTVCHLGRSIPAPVKTALLERDRHCVVPGCDVEEGLELDHWAVSFAEGGPASLANLACLCHHHHYLKTFEGWSLSRAGPTDDNPGWTFEPQPPFGQEPGLGIDGPSP